jgi:hypothetical protein
MQMYVPTSFSPYKMSELKEALHWNARNSRIPYLKLKALASPNVLALACGHTRSVFNAIQSCDVLTSSNPIFLPVSSSTNQGPPSFLTGLEGWWESRINWHTVKSSGMLGRIPEGEWNSMVVLDPHCGFVLCTYNRTPVRGIYHKRDPAYYTWNPDITNEIRLYRRHFPLLRLLTPL